MDEPVLDVLGCGLAVAWHKGGPDESVECLSSAGGLFAQVTFELAPEVLDWVEVGRVGGQRAVAA